MSHKQECVNIGTISGGIVNFGGAKIISPITISKTTTGSGSENTGENIITKSGRSTTDQAIVSDILNKIKTML